MKNKQEKEKIIFGICMEVYHEFFGLEPIPFFQMDENEQREMKNKMEVMMQILDQNGLSIEVITQNWIQNDHQLSDTLKEEIHRIKKIEKEKKVAHK